MILLAPEGGPEKCHWSGSEAIALGELAETLHLRSPQGSVRSPPPFSASFLLRGRGNPLFLKTRRQKRPVG